MTQIRCCYGHCVYINQGMCTAKTVIYREGTEENGECSTFQSDTTHELCKRCSTPISKNYKYCQECGAKAN